jgi:MHS family proline/betaine transporter-like MFS transporter
MVAVAHAQAPRVAIITGVVGNVVEWYDFSVYGYFAPIIAGLFFPSRDPFASLLATFAVFAVGFVMRPVGAVLFGHYGDRAGRRNALAATVILMAAGTALIGVLPTYAQAGVLAPALLVAARLLQGLSAGGEWGGSTSFLVEYAPESRRGFIGSWQQFSTAFGLLLGSGLGFLLTSTFSQDALQAWGWRLPFLVGSLVGIIGLYMRLRIEETPKFRAIEKAGEVARSPLLETLRMYPREILAALGFTLLWTVSYYVFLTFMPTYLSSVLKVPLSQAFLSNTLGLLFFIGLIPVMGAISDRLGRKPLLILSAIGFAVLTYPLFAVISQGVFLLILVAQLAFGFLEALYSGPGPAAIAEIFPTRVRYSALSIGYNVAVAAFGGTAPFIATYVIAQTGNNLSPTIYVVLSALITLVVLLRIKETHQQPLR